MYGPVPERLTCRACGATMVLIDRFPKGLDVAYAHTTNANRIGGCAGPILSAR